jgi:hypothetical protein
MGLLDYSGPVEKAGRPGYARHTGSLDGGSVMTAEGVVIDTTPLTAFARAENARILWVVLAKGESFRAQPA